MLTIYTLEQASQWDAVVRSFEQYDVYYLSGYVKAFQIHGDGEPLLFYYEDVAVRGINVVMKRDIAHDIHFQGKLTEGQYFDFSTPYGYGGWLIEGKETENLFTAYECWCQKNGIVSEFVRFHPVLENHEYTGDTYDVIPLGNTIKIDLASPESIWSHFTSQNRNKVRKAQKSGIHTYNGRYPEIYETFWYIYNQTMDKDNADSYYYFQPQFYESILNDLCVEGQVFYAELNKKVIASSIMLASNGRLNYHLSGSLREYQNLAPMNLLLYEAALWGNANGCKTFHLGGGVGSKEDSLYMFKKSFYRGEPCKFYIGRKTFLQEQYNELLGLRTDIQSPGYFPKYRG